MKVTKIEINKKAAAALLKSAEVQADLKRRAEAIQEALPTGNGEEWAVNTFIGFDRAQATVRTANFAAQKADAENHALIRALDRGR